MLFLSNSAVSQNDSAPTHTAGAVQSWFEEHEDELPSPALWSVLETRVTSRFPPPTSLKQLLYVLQEEWYKIPLETVQNLYKSIPRRTVVVL
jgi:hypothetical protein